MVCIEWYINGMKYTSMYKKDDNHTIIYPNNLSYYRKQIVAQI